VYYRSFFIKGSSLNVKASDSFFTFGMDLGHQRSAIHNIYVLEPRFLQVFAADRSKYILPSTVVVLLFQHVVYVVAAKAIFNQLANVIELYLISRGVFFHPPLGYKVDE